MKNFNRHYNQQEVGNKHLLFIPKSMQQELLSWTHDHSAAGHSGQQKTIFQLSICEFWESMRKDVYNYVASCQACQKFEYDKVPMANPVQMYVAKDHGVLLILT